MRTTLKVTRLSVAELRRDYGKHLRMGYCIIVTIRGKSVALLTPLDNQTALVVASMPGFPLIKMRSLYLWFSAETESLRRRRVKKAFVTQARNNSLPVPIATLTLLSEKEAVRFDERLVEAGIEAVNETMGWVEQIALPRKKSTRT